MRGIKGKTVRELQTKQRRSNTTIPTSCSGFKLFNIKNCMTCHLISDCLNITSTVTYKTVSILGDKYCSSSNVIYAYQCYFCNKQYIGETSTSLRITANGHRFTSERKHQLSSLYTQVKVHTDNSSLPDYNRPSLGGYILIPTEQIHSSYLID